METILSSRLMDGVMELRRRGKFSIPCKALVGGTAKSGLLGPRVDGCPNDVCVIVDGSKRVLPLGQVSVDASVVAQIDAVLVELDRSAAYRERTDTDLINRLLISRYQARRRPSGRFAGHYVEPAGRR